MGGGVHHHHLEISPKSQDLSNFPRKVRYFLFFVGKFTQIGVPYHDKLREKSPGIDRSRGVRSPRAQEHCLTPSGCKVIAFWKVSSDIGFSCKTINTNRRGSFKRFVGDRLSYGFSTWNTFTESTVLVTSWSVRWCAYLTRKSEPRAVNASLGIDLLRVCRHETRSRNPLC